MSNQTNDKQVILAVAGALLLLSYAYYIGAYWLVLGGAYGACLSEIYNRTSFGKRLREKLKKNQRGDQHG